MDRGRHPDRMVLADRGRRICARTGARSSANVAASGPDGTVRVHHLCRSVLELTTMTKTMTSLAEARPAEIEQFRNYIDGEWIAGGSGEWLDNVKPADTEDIVGRFPASTADDAEAAVNAASSAFAAWRKTPVSARAKILNQAASY